jgi:hypothetical protein
MGLTVADLTDAQKKRAQAEAAACGWKPWKARPHAPACARAM